MPNQPVYDGSVAIDTGSGRLRGEWAIHVARDAGHRDSLTLLLNQGLRILELTGPYVTRYRDTVSGGLRRVTVWLTDGRGNTAIILRYDGTPRFSSDSINGIGPRWVELALDSFWLPVISDFAHTITGSVRVGLPERWVVATSGEVTRGRSAQTIQQGIPLIDIPFSASPDFKAFEGRRSRILHVGAADSAVRMVADVADRCAAYLDGMYGKPAPLPHLRIVVAPRTGPGYARKNYIVITSLANATPRSLTRFLCHEVAHFWANGAISSGPDNWLNEGFAEFVSDRAVRAIIGAAASDTTIASWEVAAREQPPIWTGRTGPRPAQRVSYAKAPLLLRRLEQRIGAGRMDEFLRRFMTGKVRTTPAVVDLLAAVAGRDVADWFAAELGR